MNVNGCEVWERVGKGVGSKRDHGFGWVWFRGGGISIETVLF